MPEQLVAPWRPGPAALIRAARRNEVRLLIVIIVAAAFVRFARLGVQSLWTDEGLTAIYVGGSVKHLLTSIPTIDANPPLFYLLEWVFVRIFGQGDAGLRTLSAVAGTLTVPVVYAIGARVASRRAGLTAAALCAVQPMLWWYSQEARTYALFTLLSALTLLAFVVALRDRSSWALALWTLFGALMLTTHYFAIVVLTPQALWLLVVWRGLRRREVMLALAGLGIVALALTVTFALEVGNPGFSKLPLGPRIRVLVPQLLASPSPPATLLWIFALVMILIGAGLALLTTPPPQRHFARVLAILAAWDLLVPVLAALAGHDYIVTRNLIATLVPVLVLAGIGFSSPWAPRLGAVGAGIIVALWLGAVGAIAANPGLQRIDTKAAVASLGPPTMDRVVFSPGTYVFMFTFPRYLAPNALWVTGKARVQEVDILIPHPGRGAQPCLAGQTCQLFATHRRPGPPAPGFHLVSRREIPPFTVLRWRASAPVLFKYSDLVASGPEAPASILFPAGAPPMALYQTPDK